LTQTVSQVGATGANVRGPRVAVLIRAHFVSEKLWNLFRMLKGGAGYDLFICADETLEPLDLGGEAVLRHSTQMCSDLGLVGSYEGGALLWYFGDYPFYCAYHSIPDYDYYIMIEYDVEFVRGNSFALETLIARLSAPGRTPYDMVATHYGPRRPDWRWTVTCEGVFEKCCGVFFPFVALSKRALQYLFEWRKSEAANPREDGRYVFCEAFVPSALIAAGGFHCANLNTLLPGCFHPSTFRVAVPMLLGRLPALDRSIELVHPVYSEREYIGSDLSNPDGLPASPDLRALGLVK
jgi:hypothetical protein